MKAIISKVKYRILKREPNRINPDRDDLTLGKAKEKATSEEKPEFAGTSKSDFIDILGKKYAKINGVNMNKAQFNKSKESVVQYIITDIKN